MKLLSIFNGLMQPDRDLLKKFTTDDSKNKLECKETIHSIMLDLERYLGIMTNRSVPKLGRFLAASK